jgi:hypothetical protein
MQRSRYKAWWVESFKRVPLDDRALRLAEALAGVATGGVGHVVGILALHGDVIHQSNVADLRPEASEDE